MSINEQPLVTVYIPTFNRLELLQRAVESVRNQTYKNLEIIVVDDCSTDGTQKYLEKLAKEDSRVRYFLKEKNSGACVSRNIAIENAKGEFITGLDDDDYFTPNRIELFLNNWSQIPKDGVALFTTNYSDEKIKKNNLLSRVKFLLSKKVVNQRDLYFANYIGNQVFTKTENLRNLNGFDENFKAWQDLDLWFRLSTFGSIIKIEEPTYYVDKSHDLNRISNQNIDKIINTRELFIKKYTINSWVYKSALNNHLFYYDKSRVGFRDVFVRLFFNFFDFKGNFQYLILFLKYKLKG